MLDTPILFLIFNRPDLTEIVFRQIRWAKPRKLYIAADGPREDKPQDVLKCQATKNVVLDHIDWDCEVKTLIREKNLGCRKAVTEAISWFFLHEEKGIILEDDCVPSSSFFRFCEEMLKVYEFQEEIAHINGTCHFSGLLPQHDSDYYYSRYMLCWGWASWRRAWNMNNTLLTNHVEIEKGLEQSSLDKDQKRYWLRGLAYFLGLAKIGKLNTWDVQWALAILANHKLCVTPIVNLVENIGFGSEATHTTQVDERMVSEIKELKLPLSSPNKLKVSELNDSYLFENLYRHWERKTLFERVVAQVSYFRKRVFPFL